MSWIGQQNSQKKSRKNVDFLGPNKNSGKFTYCTICKFKNKNK
jgi:hypothetical protein